MAVGKHQYYGIVAHRLDALDLDILLAELQDFLARAVSAHLGRGGIHPQKLVGQFKPCAVVEGDFHLAGNLMQLDFRGDGGGFVESRHGPSLLPCLRLAKYWRALIMSCHLLLGCLLLGCT